METSKEKEMAQEAKTEVATATIVPITKKEDDEINLQNLSVEFTKQVMEVPTVSSSEYRLVTFIILWARRNKIKYDFDAYGNIYLTKGELEDGEFYPCVTSHLDTVQSKQKAYAQAGAPLALELKKETSGKHKLSVEGMGIGADCKTGVLISLSLFDHFDKLKAAFFLEEEIGMIGSKHLDKSFFDNVGYVVGWDSPDLNRAAWSCSGTKLMSKDFFEKHLKDVCKKHGLDKFKAEPYTDVKNIREETELMCMNFGNGGYNAHCSNEYMILEDTDHALTMGIDIIKELGLKQYKLAYTNGTTAWVRQADGTYKPPVKDEDEEYFDKMEGKSYYSNNYGGSYGGYNGYGSGSTTSTSGSTSNTNKTETHKAPSVDVETLKYVAERYEEKISIIKENVKKKCEDLGVDFADFAAIFEESVRF